MIIIMDVIRQLSAYTVGYMEWFHMHFFFIAASERVEVGILSPPGT